MAYVQFAAYHVPVLHVRQCLTNHGFPVFSQQNRHATNLSLIVLIGEFWAYITIGISFTSQQNQCLITPYRKH